MNYPSLVYIKDKIEKFDDTISEFGIYYNYFFDYDSDGNFTQQYQS